MEGSGLELMKSGRVGGKQGYLRLRDWNVQRKNLDQQLASSWQTFPVRGQIVNI